MQVLGRPYHISVAEDNFDGGRRSDGGFQLGTLAPVGQPQRAQERRRPVEHMHRAACLGQGREPVLQSPYCGLPTQ